MTKDSGEPMFVSVDGDTWVNVEHIVAVAPEGDRECSILLSTGDVTYAKTPARDFLNRMTGEVWK